MLSHVKPCEHRVKPHFFHGAQPPQNGAGEHHCRPGGAMGQDHRGQFMQHHRGQGCGDVTAVRPQVLGAKTRGYLSYPAW